MSTKNYIKVTPRGAKEPVIVLAALADFYRSQKAKVEEASEEEILSTFPEEATKAASAPAGNSAEADSLRKEVKALQADKAALVADVNKAKKENIKLREELEATKAALTESEALVQKLSSNKGSK